VNALRNIHMALVPGGIAVDTQPVSARPAVTVSGTELGAADMRQWVATVRALDRRAVPMIHKGHYRLLHEERLTVTDTFSDGPESVEIMRGWRGTSLPPELVRRLAAVETQVQLHQQVRIRLLNTRESGSGSACRQ
jgi:hypothetical protein